MTPPRPAVSYGMRAENPMQKIGFFLMLAFLFLAYSRVLDLTLPGLHLPLILSLMAFAATIAFGGVQRAFSSTVGKLLFAFTIWMLICTPFSSWRGGSVEMLRDEWSKAFLCYVMVAGLTVSVRQSRQVMMTLALAALTAAIIGNLMQFHVEDRLALPEGLLTSPNDFAQILLLGLPFWTLPLIPRGGLLKLLTVIFASAFLTMTIYLTGSRAALLASVVMAGFLFIRASLRMKFGLFVAGVLAAGALVLVSPRNLMERYLTTLNEPDPGERVTSDEAAAVESLASRKLLFFQSIELTLTHPIFGVGPGVYQHASTLDFNRRGMRSLWKESHNAFTQVSSESGIPGFLLFTGALFSSFLGLARLRRRTARDPRWGEIASLSFCLTMSLLGFAITSFFSSIAYKFFFPTVLGLAAAFLKSAQDEMQRPAVLTTSASPPAVPASWSDPTKPNPGKARPAKTQPTPVPLRSR
jgi:O-antigen ligase